MLFIYFSSPNLLWVHVGFFAGFDFVIVAPSWQCSTVQFSIHSSLASSAATSSRKSASSSSLRKRWVRRPSNSHNRKVWKELFLADLRCLGKGQLWLWVTRSLFLKGNQYLVEVLKLFYFLIIASFSCDFDFVTWYAYFDWIIPLFVLLAIAVSQGSIHFKLSFQMLLKFLASFASWSSLIFSTMFHHITMF